MVCPLLSILLEVTVLLLFVSADVAVDWINDKLYWSDRDYKKIEEVDIITRQRRIVIQLDATSIPLGLVVYPLEGHGYVRD